MAQRSASCLRLVRLDIPQATQDNGVAADAAQLAGWSTTREGHTPWSEVMTPH